MNVSGNITSTGGDNITLPTGGVLYVTGNVGADVLKVEGCELTVKGDVTVATLTLGGKQSDGAKITFEKKLTVTNTMTINPYSSIDVKGAAAVKDLKVKNNEAYEDAVVFENKLDVSGDMDVQSSGTAILMKPATVAGNLTVNKGSLTTADTVEVTGTFAATDSELAIAEHVTAKDIALTDTKVYVPETATISEILDSTVVSTTGVTVTAGNKEAEEVKDAVEVAPSTVLKLIGAPSIAKNTTEVIATPTYTVGKLSDPETVTSKDGKVVDTYYTVDVTVTTDKVITKHANANGSEAYWIGFGVDKKNADLIQFNNYTTKANWNKALDEENTLVEDSIFKDSEKLWNSELEKNGTTYKTSYIGVDDATQLADEDGNGGFWFATFETQTVSGVTYNTYVVYKLGFTASLFASNLPTEAVGGAGE